MKGAASRTGAPRYAARAAGPGRLRRTRWIRLEVQHGDPHRGGRHLGVSRGVPVEALEGLDESGAVVEERPQEGAQLCRGDRGAHPVPDHVRHHQADPVDPGRARPEGVAAVSRLLLGQA